MIKDADAATGWSYEVGDSLTPGGVVLRNIFHWQYHFAKDVRVIGIRLEIEEVQPNGQVTKTVDSFYELSSEHFSIGQLRRLHASPVDSPSDPSVFRFLKATDECLNHNSYFKSKDGNSFGCGVRADYISKDDFFKAWPNCEVKSLAISQIFLFSPSTLRPAHEPSGNLPAARFHPMTKYRFAPNDQVNRKKAYYRVRSIRVDYRLHLHLDKFAKEEDTGKIIDSSGNQVGLFRDNDVAFGKWGVVAQATTELFTNWVLMNPIGPDTATSSVVFAAAEKPGIWEVVMPATSLGLPVLVGSDGKINECWDNIHWWGARKGNDLPSTPGGFHVAHLHWRWGAVIQDAPAGQAPGFRAIESSPPHPAYENMWGPLVDPRAWIQTILAGIVKYDPRTDPSKPDVDLKNLSRPDFKEFISAKNPDKPDDKTTRPADDIESGANLVLWFSIKVDRNGPNIDKYPKLTQDITTGTLFYHGIFFAHEMESSSKYAGTTGAIYKPNSPKQRRLFRSASVQ